MKITIEINSVEDAEEVKKTIQQLASNDGQTSHLEGATVTFKSEATNTGDLSINLFDEDLNIDSDFTGRSGESQKLHSDDFGKSDDETPKEKRARIKAELKSLGIDVDSSKAATDKLEARLAKKLADLKKEPVETPVGTKPGADENEITDLLDELDSASEKEKVTTESVREKCKIYLKLSKVEKLYKLLEDYGGDRKLSVIETKGLLNTVDDALNVHIAGLQFREKHGADKTKEILMLVGKKPSLWDVDISTHELLTKAFQEGL